MEAGPWFRSFNCLDEDFSLHFFCSWVELFGSEVSGGNWSPVPCPKHHILAAWIAGLWGKGELLLVGASGRHESCTVVKHSPGITRDCFVFFPLCTQFFFSDFFIFDSFIFKSLLFLYFTKKIFKRQILRTLTKKSHSQEKPYTNTTWLLGLMKPRNDLFKYSDQGLGKQKV